MALLSLPVPLLSVLWPRSSSQLSIGGTLRTGANYMLVRSPARSTVAAIAVLVPHAGEAALLAVLVIAVAPLALHYSTPQASVGVVPISTAISSCC